MTFSQDDAPRRSQPTRNFNLKQKGLGWVPDLPDQRDYTLSSEQIQIEKRLKRSKNTEWIEDIGDNLVQALESINRIIGASTVEVQFQPEQIEALKALPDKLKAKIFGDITFGDIKLYKVFRKDSPPHADVIKLKIYLSILGYRGFFGIPNNDSTTAFTDYKGTGQKSYDTHENWYMEWIKSNEFLDDTEELVQSFQKRVGLHPWGIVSMATYTSLAESLKYPGQEFAQFKEELIDKRKSIQLVPIPITLPRLFLDVCFKELKLIAAQQINQEIEQIIRSAQGEKESSQDLYPEETDELFEVGAIRKIEDCEDDEVIVFQELFGSLLPGTDGEFLDKNKILKELNKILSENGFKTSGDEGSLNDEGYEQLRKIVQAEHFVIEPILTFILKVTFPLALHQRDVQNSVLQAIKFLNIISRARNSEIGVLRKKLDSFGENILKDYSNTELKELQQFSIQSLKTFQKLFDRAGLGSVIEDRREDRNSFNPTLCFYFLLSKLVKSLQLDLDEESANTGQVPELIKTEFFRLESTQNKEVYGLFSHPELGIPISNNFYTSVKSDKIPYFYLPGSVDLSYWCSAIEDQGRLNACSAFAGIALLEYFANRSSGTYMDASPLFLYKAARNLAQASGDVGASLRETMRAMEKFGVPPIQYWPYLPDKVDEEPPQFCYSFAQNYQALKYFRLDYASISEETLLSQIKAVLAAGFPCAFGLTLYSSADDNENVRKGWIPLPTRNDRRVGGHAVVAVGYSDFETVGQKEEGNRPGAFLIRNSWGTNWGRGGYGWLPYDYVLRGLTADWWSLLKATWFEQDSFGLSASDPGGIYPFTSSPR